MKKITLFMPDDLLRKSQVYAKKHHTTLNTLVLQLLSEKVAQNNPDVLTQLFAEMDKVKISQTARWNREDLYKF